MTELSHLKSWSSLIKVCAYELYDQVVSIKRYLYDVYFCSALSKKKGREKKVTPPLEDKGPLLMLGQLEQRLTDIKTCQDPTDQC